MSEFRPAFIYTLKFEDRRAWNQIARGVWDERVSGELALDNNGAKVKFGINARWHPELFESPGGPTFPQALACAQTQYWDPLPLRHLASQAVANKVFDQCFHLGEHEHREGKHHWVIAEAGKLLQRALNHLAATSDAGRGRAYWEQRGILDAQELIAEDGIIGRRTVEAANVVSPEQLLAALRFQEAEFIKLLAAKRSDIAALKDELLGRANA